MEKISSKLVGIVIPTLNRPDFIIRQLEYYAEVNSPHPVYIGDASNRENSEKLQKAIKRLSNYLNISYYPQPEYTVPEAHIDLYARVKENYCIFSGDDDYQVPNSLTKCAEFLENNPDYSSASGYAVTFRLTNSNGVYGELKRLADYPRKEIKSETSAQRLIDFMSKYNVVLFSVQRTEQMKKCWLGTTTIEDLGFANEILPCAMSSVLGKSKIIDCLSLVRQLDNVKLVPLNTFEWITGKDWKSPDITKNWSSSFNIFCEILAKEISIIDGINLDEARKIPRMAFWNYLNINLPMEYNKLYSHRNTYKKIGHSKAKKYLIKKLPWLKDIYLNTLATFTNKHRDFFYRVNQKKSPYFNDFQQIFNSFTGNYKSHF